MGHAETADAENPAQDSSWAPEALVAGFLEAWEELQAGLAARPWLDRPEESIL